MDETRPQTEIGEEVANLAAKFFVNVVYETEDVGV